MKRFKVKIWWEGKEQPVWLQSYKQVSMNEYHVNLHYEEEEGGFFDEDDYIFRLCDLWFKRWEKV